MTRLTVLLPLAIARSYGRTEMAKPDRRKRVRHRDSNKERRRHIERFKNTGHAEDIISASLLVTVARENQKHCSNDTMALLRHGLKKREELTCKVQPK